MDNLSSSELDAPSKTPLFFAIAAVIVGLAGLALGWLGFTRASELEQQLASVQEASAGLVELEALIEENAQRLDKMASDMTTFSQEVSRVLGAVEDDISGIKKNVRAVAIEAGTAKKMVEELEKKGVQVAAAPPPRVESRSAAEGGSGEGKSESTGASNGAGGTYTIKSGDTLGKIAAAYNISLGDLLAANPGIDPRRLRIGQQIDIPAAQ